MVHHWKSIQVGNEPAYQSFLDPSADRAFIAPVAYMCYVLGDAASHAAGVSAIDDEEPSYFGDAFVDSCPSQPATLIN